MTEFNIGTLAVLSLFGLVTGSFFYMWGGRTNKWLRRVIGSVVIASTVIIMLVVFQRFQWIHLLIYPMLFIGFSLGYSGGSVKTKLISRSIYALGVCSSGVLLAYTLGGNAWLILPIHLGVGAWSIWLGIKNPVHASSEEVFICVLLNIGLLMYPFIAR